MNSIKKSKIFKLILFVFVLLIFFKIDFRFENGIYCCGDDYDYYSHAETIAFDFDLDYSNQLKGYEDRRFNLNGKVAPKGFFGSGLLASPFLFLGSFFDFLSKKYFSQSYTEFMNYKLFIYSFSSITYMFLTIGLLKKIVIRLNKKITSLEIFLFYSSSGVIYYAFERFSMAHIYETFSISLIIYFSFKFFAKENKDLNAFLVPLSILLALLVRLTNYYVFLIPFIVRILFFKKNKDNIYKNKFFVFSSFLSVFIYSYITKKIYGIVSINPETLYGANGVLKGFIKDVDYVDFLITNIKNTFLILFGPEFGILWFSPIIFFGIVSALLPFNRETVIEKIVLLIPFAMCFFSVLLWKSAASSYGFRYLSSLVPLSIVYFYSNINYKYYESIRRVLIFFSIFSILSILFFETTELTQLSTSEELNSFGRNIKYVEPLYLKGVLLSFFEIGSYLKIFVTSFFGVLVFKGLIMIVGESSLIDLLTRFKLPTENEDFLLYLNEVGAVSITKLLIVLGYFLYISKIYIDELEKT